MEVGKLIRTMREQAQMSQDDLAQRIYVSRQTISSWENGKTYPDLKSLLLLSDVFDATVDEIVGKDVERMGKSIEESIRTFKRITYAMTASYALMMASLLWLAVQLLAWDWPFAQVAPTICLVAVFFVATIALAVMVERLKKDNDLVTFHEIIAFMNGEELVRDAKQRKQLTGSLSMPRLFGQFALGVAVGIVFAIIAVAVVTFARG